ncbi:hypothetical protein HFP05_06865 [Rhodanobacter denitrificans]|nr:hypothetical protein [Rhodanobacter denitrificans]
MPPHHSTEPAESTELTRSFLGVFRYSGRALELVWSTSRPLTIALALLTLVAACCRPAWPTLAHTSSTRW